MTDRALMRQLLRDHVNSFEKLHLLAALRAAPTGTLSEAELASTLRIKPNIVRDLGNELERAGIVVRAAGNLSLSMTSDLSPIVDDLLRMYEVERLVVVIALSQIAMERIREMTALTFGTAFPRKPSDGDPE
jgi:hypothetical protein